LVIAAFAAVYLFWGATYLGIRIAVTSIPPFLMAGSRFVIAGSILYAWMRCHGAPRPEPAHWRSAAIIGALLLLVGNGGVAWAQQSVPTSVTALVLAATPLWMILVEWLRPLGNRPHRLVFLGLVLGFCGVALIVLGRDAHGHRVLNPAAALVLLAAPVAWSIGSIFSRHARQTETALLNVAMQMISGGALMLGASFAFGEIRGFQIAEVTRASWMAFGYLTIAGSLIGFTSYVWLLQVSTPARVSTYAFVNPLIAVMLGRCFLHEPLPKAVLLAGSLILGAVLAITWRSQRKT
jgi:drug/metabolite transporter (DMT)-like permease